jgi:acetyl esterase/lipase
MALDTVSRKPEDLLKLADIHPELDAWIKANGETTATPTDYKALRQMFALEQQRYLNTIGPKDISGVLVESITVKARDGYDIPVKTYRPKNSSVPGPLIIEIHGGGYTMGSPIGQEAHCLQYVQELGASCVNIDYRLAPEHKWPTAVYDCYDALAWAAAHASELGANPQKGFIIEGPSAGGNLTDVVGHMARDAGLNPPVTGLCEIITSVLRSDVVPEKYKLEFLSWHQDMPYGLSREASTRHAEWYQGDSHSELFCPFNWPSGHAGLPPVFFQIHGMDPLRDGGLIYEKRLREEDGVKTKLKVYPGLPHGFNALWPQFETSKEHERDTLEGIRWLLSFSKGE